ncbi:hypothetical protein PUN28_020227 [Cardiocondyla obscurior]|uniref:28S ribosomal protein S9, mitochondrial n=1 Tax=Cardiocondyla obscurior TaxID=286306 RepID=A0AAW2E6Y0_9HYME
MAVSTFIRCTHFRRLIGLSNNAVTFFSDTSQRLLQNRVVTRSYTTPIEEIKDIDEINSDTKKMEKKISKAMLMYLQRAKEHDQFMKKEIAEYEIGKRYLANMMGEDPEYFTQTDIDKAIEYLFPSGLYDPKARPIMQHPETIFPNRKEAEFDETGRPFHSMFYTSKPNYYEALYNIVDKIKSLNDIEDSFIRQGNLHKDQINLINSTWLLNHEIEKQILEPISDSEYNYFITSLQRLCDHPLSKHATDLIMKYRKILTIDSDQMIIPPLEYDNTGRPYIKVANCMRKTARGEVTIWGKGSGNIIINGHDITYFEEFHNREQAGCEPYREARFEDSRVRRSMSRSI